MAIQDQATQTSHYRKKHSLILKDGLQFVSSLIIPVMLGVFTVVTTIHQQKTAREQRLEDLNESRHQRLEDLNESRYQRLQEENHQRDLATIVIDVANMFKKNNGSLTSDNVTATIARVKALTTFRQLDAQRNIQIIRFLYESGQLTKTAQRPSLDLSTAKFCNMDFRELAVNEKQLDELSLTGVALLNATFEDIEISNSNFANIQLNNVNFSLGTLHAIKFSFSRFNDVNLSYGQLRNVNFSSSVLVNVNFSFVSMFEVQLPLIQLKHGNFSFVVLFNGDFSSARLENVNFSGARLNNIDFSSTVLFNVDFSHSQLANVTFFRATLHRANFSFVEFYGPIFTHAQLNIVNFSSAILVSANFTDIKASYTDFEETSCVGAHFDGAVFSNCSFWLANIKRASFRKSLLEIPTLSSIVDFSFANLYGANFENASVLYNQLQGALSIQDVVLPNRTLAHDTNLINNGHADCSASSVDGWTLLRGDITTVMFDASSANCRFQLQSFDIGAAMKQHVNLSHKWDSDSWPYSEAVLRGHTSIGVSIQLTGIINERYIYAPKRLSNL
ncbi:unnamed protein product [Rotaria magnacalcarata]|uniref:Pentapeptide repeat-containing protein n=1 Tax=Rotaria magnacalcarata TaxID=392030 RepID=A0A815W0P8_9BILA|nr:unnamed protein product [Rotaria magnacalcarata]CAF4595627.1 unnamed protein product [Rotaria magnacalcarata]